jgi:hypothetical protein
VGFLLRDDLGDIIVWSFWFQRIYLFPILERLMEKVLKEYVLLSDYADFKK